MTPLLCWTKVSAELRRLRGGMAGHPQEQVRVQIIDAAMKLLDDGIITFEEQALEDIRRNGT